jgi:hypothetical protein
MWFFIVEQMFVNLYFLVGQLESAEELLFVYVTQTFVGISSSCFGGVSLLRQHLVHDTGSAFEINFLSKYFGRACSYMSIFLMKCV